MASDRMNVREESLNRKLFRQFESFKAMSGMDDYVDQAQRFYNGKQYPSSNSKGMVRVSLNICSWAAIIKSAKVVGTPIYITYVADVPEVDARKLQRFDEYNRRKLNEDTENFQSALNGFVNATEITYMRWDYDDTTYKGIYKGGLAYEHIDPRDFAVANPTVQEIQNQKWVMFRRAEELSAVRDVCEGMDDKDKERRREAIHPDGEALSEMDANGVNHKLVTVYTRFFKIRGEVFFMCSTEDVDLFPYPHAINPKADKALAREAVKEWERKIEDGDDSEKIADFGIDPQDLVMQLLKPERISAYEYDSLKERFYLYPFARFAPFEINKSFYARSDVDSLIPIQKGINFGISMLLMCAQNNAYNKIFVKEGALKGQEITNEPGQVLVDHSRFTNGWGIKFAESQPMPNGLSSFIGELLGQTRLVYGFNDVMDGSVSNKDISGYAVQQMIKQANTSIEQQQKLFWRFCKDKAAIRLMFYRFFVDEARYAFEIPAHEVEEEEQARKALLGRRAQVGSLEIGDVDLSVPTRKARVETIRGEDISGASFDIDIDVKQGLVESELTESQMWDTLIMNGGIQNLEPEMLEMYLEASPIVSERTKAALKSVVERQKREENAQLKEQLQQAVQSAQQLAQYARQLEQQNGYMGEYNKNLTKEFSQKISTANKVIGALSRPTSAEPAKTEGERKSENATSAARAEADQA